LVSEVVAATPKISPKIETVPSSMPNTMVPAESANERRRRCRVVAIVTDILLESRSAAFMGFGAAPVGTMRRYSGCTAEQVVNPEPGFYGRCILGRLPA
jgi:hypothetical protein